MDPNIKKYKLVKILDEDKLSTLYLVISTSTQKLYTLRQQRVLQNKKDMKFSTKCFEQEINQFKLLDHPFIVKYVEAFKMECGTQKWRWFIVQEYTDDQTLYTNIILNKKAPAIPERQTIQWLSQIILALQEIIGANKAYPGMLILEKIVISTNENQKCFARIRDLGIITNAQINVEKEENKGAQKGKQLIQKEDLLIQQLGLLICDILLRSRFSDQIDRTKHLFDQFSQQLIDQNIYVSQDLKSLIHSLLTFKVQKETDFTWILDSHIIKPTFDQSHMAKFLGVAGQKYALGIRLVAPLKCTRKASQLDQLIQLRREATISYLIYNW
ncbi:hypothetical protein FGO68_gene17050 [Halteria grandinella]|uniref:non-specific serine/threonine protein kinase n=1 Tax=Halteria grandinella TaxID=5974 RepID=A0A8J8NSA0_HALGN|nr:hypothetical protein FGO68_gene17050 [Halteria grandinella]